MKNKIIYFLAFGALLAWAGYMAATYERKQESPAEPAAGATSSWKAYASDYGFAFRYPAEASVAEPTISFLGNPIIQIELDRRSEFAGTNYAGEQFSASFDAQLPAERCYAPENSEPLGEESINGNIFRISRKGDAAAGNFYESRVYRTHTGGGCLEIAATLHTTNIGNYEPGTVVPADMQEAWRVLETIIGTIEIGKR